MASDTVRDRVATRLINVDALKAEIAEELSIAQIAERLCGVALQRSGNQWVGLCPLHSESTPSFYLNEGKGQLGVWHCYGCKDGGDGIDLVRKVRHLSFVEALYALAAEADVEIERFERPLSAAERAAAQLRNECEAWLAAADFGAVSRIDKHIAMEFGVGLANQGAQRPALPSYLIEGIVFPYRLPNGALAGWKTRTEGDKRFYRTPETFPLNAPTLFGIQIAREHLYAGNIVVVEGEYDCMTAHAYGIKNVVALGGSAFTAEQMEMLEHLHVRQITFVFDGDEAGHKAARATAERYWVHDIMVRVTVCRDDEDPDSLIRNYGAIEFDAAIRNARHALEHLLWIEWESRSRSSLSSKLDFVGWIRETYGAKLRSTDEALVLKEVAKWLDLPEIDVRDFAKQNDTSLQVTDSERILLSRALRDVRYYIDLRKRFAQDDFFLTKHQRIWDILARMMVDGNDFDIPTIARYAEAEGISREFIDDLAQLNSTNLDYHEEQVLDMALRRFARDDALAFKNLITDINRPSDVAIGELTHRITERALRKSGLASRQISEQVDDAMDVLHERMRNPNEIHGLDLGRQFPRTSAILQGLQPARLILIAAASGVGKSTLMLQISCSLSVHQSIPTDVISLEMDENEVISKIASHMTGIDSMAIMGGRLEGDEVKKVEFAYQRIRKSPLHIWCPDGLTASEFLLYARESVMQRRTEAFFIDYVQLTDPDPGMERDSGYTRYGHFGRVAKMKVARAMDVSVVCCAQLTREAESKDRPNKADMADSYALVRHSDVIVILSPRSSDNCELYVDKNRQGKGGNVTIPLKHNKPHNTFYEADSPAIQPEYAVKLT